MELQKNSPNSNHPNKANLNLRLTRIETDINDIILLLENKKKPFTAADVVNTYLKKKSDLTFEDYYNQLIKSFKESGKNGNAVVYQSSLESVKDFIGNRKIRLDEIDFSFVKKYQRYLESKEIKVKESTPDEYKKKLTVNGISFYLRTLRAIINKAIKDDLIDETSYPFKNISIKSQKTRKRAVNKDVIKMVEEQDVSKEENLQFPFPVIKLGLRNTFI